MTLSEIKRMGEFSCNTSHLNRMCAKIKETPAKVYDLIKEYGGLEDTVTREAIFSYIADKYHNGNYDIVYNKWLA
jgi:hypothetical protein